MYNKKMLLSCILVLTVSSTMLAQAPTVQTPKAPSLPASPDPAAAGSGNSKFYVKAYGGYGLLTPGSYKTFVLAGNNNTVSFATVSPGLGGGLHYGGGVGYIFSDFLNIGLDADYLNGKNLKTTLTTTDYSSSSTVSHSVFSLIPNITFKAISKPTYFIYNRLGIILAVGTKLNQSSYDTSSANLNVYSEVDNVKYNFSLNAGIQAAIGVQFQIAGNFRGFAEVVGNYLPVSATSSVQASQLIRYSNGAPSGTSITYLTQNYEKAGSLDAQSSSASSGTPSNPITTTTSSQNSPKTTGSFNINYIGINIGVVYRL